MIASLPMYDRPETAAANDRLWALVRKSLGYGPARLSRDVEGLDHWLSPDLLLSQTCGMPYRLHLHGKVQLVGTPVWSLEDERGGYYHSVLIARKDPFGDDLYDGLYDFMGQRLACNVATSQSGWAAAQTTALDHGFSFTDVIETGSHRASAQAVFDGRANGAAIDAVTWELIKRYDRAISDGLKVVHRTESTPTLPYITAMGQKVDDLFDALSLAITHLSKQDQETLCLRGVTKIAADDYLAVPSPAFPEVTTR